MKVNNKQLRQISSGLGFLFLTSLSSLSLGQDKGGISMASSTIKRDTIITHSEEKFPVITNMFFDNWFMNVGAGAQVYFGDHNKQMKSSDRISPAFDVNIGKWFSPGLGVRAGVSGLKAYGATQNKSYSTGEIYDASQWLENQEIEYYHVHADALFNISNIFGGYKERFYSISPYLGLGLMQTTKGFSNRDITANIGIYNAFRLGSAIDLTLDVRGALVNDGFDGEVGNRREDGVLSASLGLAYKFKQRGWAKPSTTIITYDEAALDAIRKQVNALERDNDALRSQLANSKVETITDIQIKDRVLAAPILVTFTINKSIVSNEARVNLGFFAKVIKSGSADVVYKVTGYADKGTGTPSINERLSIDRANAIYNVLVKEFGVSANQLEVAHKGGVENMFYDDPRVSRAVIVIAE